MSQALISKQSRHETNREELEEIVPLRFLTNSIPWIPGYKEYIDRYYPLLGLQSMPASVQFADHLANRNSGI